MKLFRQHRDIRFSRDKSPYKTRTYGIVRERPRASPRCTSRCPPRGCSWAPATTQLEPAQLGRFRDAVADAKAGPKLERAVDAAHAGGVETFGEALKTAPRGYPKDHPRIALLRHRSLFAGRRLGPKARGITRQAAINHARATFDACGPMNAWLDAYVGAS